MVARRDDGGSFSAWLAQGVFSNLAQDDPIGARARIARRASKSSRGRLPTARDARTMHSASKHTSRTFTDVGLHGDGVDGGFQGARSPLRRL